MHCGSGIKGYVIKFLWQKGKDANYSAAKYCEEVLASLNRHGIVVIYMLMCKKQLNQQQQQQNDSIKITVNILIFNRAQMRKYKSAEYLLMNSYVWYILCLK